MVCYPPYSSLPHRDRILTLTLVAFEPSTAYLTSATINDPSLTAQCVTRDVQGNQVRAFGGPNFGDVESVQFVPADGRQIYTIACSIA